MSKHRCTRDGCPVLVPNDREECAYHRRETAGTLTVDALRALRLVLR